jgi:hypothetical protein
LRSPCYGATVGFSAILSLGSIIAAPRHDQARFFELFPKIADRSRPASNRRILRSTSRRRFDLTNSLHLIQVEDGDNAVTAISRTRRAINLMISSQRSCGQTTSSFSAAGK